MRRTALITILTILALGCSDATSDPKTASQPAPEAKTSKESPPAKSASESPSEVPAAKTPEIKNPNAKTSETKTPEVKRRPTERPKLPEGFPKAGEKITEWPAKILGCTEAEASDAIIEAIGRNEFDPKSFERKVRGGLGLKDVGFHGEKEDRLYYVARHSLVKIRRFKKLDYDLVKVFDPSRNRRFLGLKFGRKIGTTVTECKFEDCDRIWIEITSDPYDPENGKTMEFLLAFERGPLERSGSKEPNMKWRSIVGSWHSAIVMLHWGGHLVWEFMKSLELKNDQEMIGAALLSHRVFRPSWGTLYPWWEGDLYIKAPRSDWGLNPWALSKVLADSTLSDAKRTVLFCYLTGEPVPSDGLLIEHMGMLMTPSLKARRDKAASVEGYAGILKPSSVYDFKIENLAKDFDKEFAKNIKLYEKQRRKDADNKKKSGGD